MNDLISRQAVIDKMMDLYNEDVELYGVPIPEGFDGHRAVEAIKEIPPAEPVEIIRCKDCKWWDKKDDSPYGYCHAVKHGYHSSNWEIGIYRLYKSDFFCADGERRGTEDNDV